jgi:peptidoglycan/LPS O-acetylase OafA/YrhL
MAETTELTEKISAGKIKPRLLFADGLRGLAAFWVVLFHMSEGNHIPSIRSALHPLANKIVFDYGDLGVAIFFVLSGFVMALTAQNVRFDFGNASKFIVRRLLRVTPPYYFAIFMALFFIFVKSHSLHLEYIPPKISAVFQHLLFLQDYFKTPQFNMVFWTLCIELQFYILFALLVWLSDYIHKKCNIDSARTIVFCFTCVIALLWPLGIIKTVIWQGGFIGFWYLFSAGVIVCWAWLNKGFFLKFAVFYTIIILAIGSVQSSNFTIVGACTAFLLLIAGLINKMDSWLSWAWLQWLGLISYSLYLLHNPITGASFKVLHKLLPNGFAAEITAFFIATSACLVIAYLSFLLIERPSINWSHRIKLKK